jgi:hypothetical protein
MSDAPLTPPTPLPSGGKNNTNIVVIAVAVAAVVITALIVFGLSSSGKSSTKKTNSGGNSSGNNKARRKVESKILANFIRMLDAEVKAFQTIDYNNGFDNTILRKIIIHRDKKWINGFIEV